MANYFDLQNGPVLTTPSALTAPKISTIGYPGDDTAADTAGGQTITLTGSGFAAGASVIINGAAVGVVSVVSSTTITFTSPAQSAGSYVLYVVNTDGGTAIAVPGIQYSGVPTWTTAAGSLGSYTETVAIANTVTATGDAPITYSVFSGSLPTGATLNSANGYISGTSPAAASPTTYTFTIRATDGQQQDTNRSFSLTINPDVVTWSSPANGTTYTSFANSAISNVALSATAASGKSITYTANALPTGLSISGSNITGTPTVVANSSTLLTATANTTNATATRTINWVISVASDTYFPYVTTLLSASTPASTFVTDASTNGFAVTVFGDTRPSNFGPYTPGYYSGFFDGTGDYLTTPTDAAFDFWAGNFTFECWFYPTGNLSNSVLFSTGSNTTGVQIYFGNNIGVYTNQGGGSFLISGTAPTLNAWAHIALTKSGSTFALFLNGVRVGTSTSTSYPTGNQSAFIGANSANSSQFVLGYISNARLVKGTAVYDPNVSTLTVPTTPLTAIANTSLLTCQSNRFIDNSTNNFTITRNGDTLISGFDPFLPSSSYAGYGSGYFDGTSDYLRVLNNAALQFGSGSFTLECWIYVTGGAGTRRQILGKTGSGAGASVYSYSMEVDASNKLTFFVSDGTGFTSVSSTNTIGLNIWYHVASVRDGNTLRIFINGAAEGTTAFASSINDTAFALGIGATGEFDGLYFLGNISNVRIVKGTAVYTSAFTPPTVPLTAIANTSLLTLQNNQPNNNNMFLDSSTNNFNITRNGNTTQGSFSPYGGGWSYYFDGTGDTISVADNAALEPTNQNFCIEAWMYPTVTGDFYWYGKGDASSAAGSTFSVTRNSTSFYIGGAGYSLSTSGAFVTNQWNHYVLSRSSGRASVFVNGSRVSTDATLGSGSLNNTSNALIIGGYTGSPLTGYLSNFRYVVGSAVYDPTQTTITVPTAPLTPIANTSLLTCADNRFIDDSPNNFAITRNGDTSIQRFNPFNPVTTTPTSYSAYFDGTGDFLSLPNNSALNISSGDFTVECWFYVTNSANTQTLFWLGGNTGSYSTIRFGVDTNALNLYFGADSTSWAINQQGLGSVVASTWYHAAVTRSGSSIRVFLNGTQVGSTITSSATFYAGTLYYLGALNYTDGGFPSYRVLTGYISNARVVKGTALYTSNFTPSTTPLTAVANTSLLTLQSPTFVDNSTNNFTITNNGDTAPRQFNPFGWTSTTGGSAAYTPALYGGSAYFDGTGDYLLGPSGNSAFAMGTGDFTLECWLYLNAKAAGTHFFSVGNGSGTTWLLGLNNTPVFEFYAAGATRIAGTTNPALGAWYHVAISRVSGSTRLFVNGVQEGSTYSDTNNYTCSAGFPIIGIRPELATPMNGYMSDLRVIKGQARYTSNFQPPIAPLTALSNTVLLNNMTGAGIYDSAMMANYETVGNSSISTSIKKYGNTSMYFDGTGDALASPANINLAVGSGDFTIEMWVNGANNGSAVGGSFPRLFTLGTAQGSGCIESYNSSGTMYVDISGAGGPISFTASTLLNSTWNHYAITRSGTSLRAFVNGTQVGTTATNSTNINLAATTQSWIGAISASAGNFNGYIDDLRITKGIARYTTTFTPPTTPFIQN